MNCVKLMIVDDNDALREMVEGYFQKQDGIKLTSSAPCGEQALEIIRREMPDVVVMDLIMPHMDGYELIEEIGKLDVEKPPQIIVLSALARDDFIKRAINAGARYYMVKPFDVSMLHRRVLEAVGEHSVYQQNSIIIPQFVAPVAQPKSLDERIGGIFLTIGIPAHIKGYNFLRSAVKMIIGDHDMINRITKELYPSIARQYNTTSSKVERAIRHAIEVAWNKGRIDNINNVFGNHIYTPGDRPTNGEFIALIADKLSLELSA